MVFECVPLGYTLKKNDNQYNASDKKELADIGVFLGVSCFLVSKDIKELHIFRG